MKKRLKSVLMVAVLCVVMTAGILLPHVGALIGVDNPITTNCPECGYLGTFVGTRAELCPDEEKTKHRIYGFCTRVYSCENASITATGQENSDPSYVDEEHTPDENGTCTVCGYCSHSKMTHHAPKAANCVEKGNIEYWSCPGCNKNFSDSAGQTPVSENNIKISIDPNNHVGTLNTITWNTSDEKHWHEYRCCHAHADEKDHDFSYSPATCTEPAKCECGKTSGTALGHKYKYDNGNYNVIWDWTKYDTDTETGYVTATFTCLNNASHVEILTDRQIDSSVKTPATYDAMGWTEYVAEVTLNGATCTGTKSVQDIPKLVRSLTHVPAKDPTCNTPGNKEYWYGKDENGNTHYYLDQEGNTETTLEGVTLPEKGHKFTNYVSNDDATCTGDGTKTAPCDHGCGTKNTIPDPGSAGCGQKIIVIDGISYEYCNKCGKINGKDILTEIQNDTLPNGYHIIIRFGTLEKNKNAMFITIVDQAGDPVEYYGKWDVLVPVAKLKEILGIPVEQDYTFTLGAVDTVTGKTEDIKVELVDGKLKFNIDFDGEDTFVVVFK